MQILIFNPWDYICIYGGLKYVHCFYVDIPQYRREDKDTQGSIKLQTHVTGGLIYTDVEGGEMPFIYYDFLQVKYVYIWTKIGKCLLFHLRKN